MTAREKRQARRRREYIIAWVIVYAFEAIMAAAAAALTAVVLIPITLQERGCFAVGGEWIAILAVYWLTYRFIHNRICDKIYGEEV